MDATTANKIMLVSSLVIIAAIPTAGFIRGFKEKTNEIRKNRSSNPIKSVMTLANTLTA